MTVMTPVRSRFFLAIGSSIVMIAGMLFGATVAAADSVQVQSYQRASQTATCDSPPESMTEWRASWANPYDPISGPTWHPSWERWANNGSGGWTCTRSITWARTPIAAISSGGGGSVTYAVGDIGPGGGLVFLISGGTTYEMAPRNWNDPTNVTAVDPKIAWCSDILNSVTTGTSVGTGSANTTAMLTSATPFVACTSSAPNAARGYAGGGYTDWFLPSKDELNAMCYYSRNLSASPDPTVSCYGSAGTNQGPAFASGLYGFASDDYWSSSQRNATSAWIQWFGNGGGDQFGGNKSASSHVRPVRAF